MPPFPVYGFILPHNERYVNIKFTSDFKMILFKLSKEVQYTLGLFCIDKRELYVAAVKSLTWIP